MSMLRKDIAPGEPHVALRRKGVTYYVPSLFHMAPTYQKVVPLLVRDVLRSKNPLEIYGTQGLRINQEGYILVNNYPVKTLKVFGRVMSFSTHNFPGKAGKYGTSSEDYEFYLLYLDDSSGEQSTICVKVDPSVISVTELEKDSILVEITGTLAPFHDGVKQILASEVTVLGNCSDLSVEVSWWAAALRMRKFLQSPWVYVPPNPANERESPEIVFQARDARKRAKKRGF